MFRNSLLVFIHIFGYAVLLNVGCGTCHPDIDCPGFTDTTLAQWFPYQDNQQLVFRNNVNESDTFTLKNTFTTRPMQSSSGGCYAVKQFFSVERSTNGREKFTAIFQASPGSGKNVSIGLRDGYIDFNDLRDTGFSRVLIGNIPANRQFASSLILGNNSFSNVFAVTRDTTTNKFPGIYKLFYAKGQGLIAYSEFPSLKTWIKQ